jgi:hypothetical protein
MSEQEEATPEAIVEEVVETPDTKDEETQDKVIVEEDSEQLKADLKEAKEAREKAEKALADKAFKNREKNRQVEEVDEDEDEKPLTRKEFLQLSAQEREVTLKKLSEEQSNKLIETYSDNPTERELISEIYKATTFPAYLSLKEQIEISHFIANRKKVLGENSELKRTLKNKTNVSKGSQGTHRESNRSVNEPAIEPQDKAEMTRLGFKWDNNKNYYSKKLSSGDFLVKDPKTKQTRIVKA